MIAKNIPCEHEWDSNIRPWEPRTHITCIHCGKIWKDMEHYVIKLTKDNKSIMEILDVGTGLKGPVAEHYWTSTKKIQRGYVCDVWKLKPGLSSIWVPLKMNALDLLDVLGKDSVDVVQAFGFLEHLEKKDGLKFLEIAEEIAIDLVIVSAAICIHTFNGNECGDDPDYKVKIDGNLYHRYNSTWQWDEFEEIGFTSNWEDAKKGDSFKLEAVAWKFL